MPMPMPDNGDMAVSPMMVRPNPIVFNALAKAITPAAKPNAAASKLTRGVLNGSQNCSTMVSTPKIKMGQPPDVTGPITRTIGSNCTDTHGRNEPMMMSAPPSAANARRSTRSEIVWCTMG